jgi:hypothetical protein
MQSVSVSCPVSPLSFDLRRPTYGENSPSLWPTMSSVMRTSQYILPLYTWKMCPQKLGRIVAPRARVLMGGARSPNFKLLMGKL